MKTFRNIAQVIKYICVSKELKMTPEFWETMNFPREKLKRNILFKEVQNINPFGEELNYSVLRNILLKFKKSISQSLEMSEKKKEKALHQIEELLSEMNKRRSKDKTTVHANFCISQLDILSKRKKFTDTKLTQRFRSVHNFPAFKMYAKTYFQKELEDSKLQSIWDSKDIPNEESIEGYHEISHK